MTSGSHASPDRPRRRPRWLRRPTSAWALGTPVMVLLCGGLFAVSAQDSDGTDLRPGRYTDLAQLVRTESRQYDRLQDRVAELQDEVTRLTEQVQDRGVSRYRRQIERLRDPAGLVEREGEGISVVLTDAPEDVIAAASEAGENLNLLVVHQQDIQAVVNAFWQGGAEAVTVQGKRIVSTTGIKCVGNSVTLEGRPYSPPYRIEAVGDQDDLATAILEDGYLEEYREDAAQPDIAVGWEMTEEDEVTAPAFDGLLGLSYAEPLA